MPSLPTLTPSGIKRSLPCHELKHQYPNGPNIDLLAIPPPLKQLRSNILRRATVSTPAAILLPKIAPPKISKLNLPVLTLQYILAFDVSMDDMDGRTVMHVVLGIDLTLNKECCLFLVQFVFPSQNVKQHA
jgi:hypothetical protein